ncbi:uncharacterized protein LOC121372044 [Gigantopelta aegis]|uniref:uncharacterized protein LOC121372044 n=1 Tax=Gigantopelta aegis TaxID=1735272 RepID=UPI001B8898D0|nr:uncharacterized protein LOC121372044 [Gigantopelta aegis]
MAHCQVHTHGHAPKPSYNTPTRLAPSVFDCKFGIHIKNGWYFTMDKVGILACVLIVISVSTVAEATCTFPSYTLGYWINHDNDNIIQFHSQTIVNFVIDTYTLDMYCFLNSGTKYVLKTNIEHPLFDETVWIYVCWDLVQDSPSTFLIYQLSDQIGEFMEERGRAYLGKDTTVPSIHSVCKLSTSTSPKPIVMTKLP